METKIRVTDAQLASAAGRAADDDGDGLKNGAEISAGTNPFQASSVIKLNTVTTNATSVLLSFPTVDGKSYVAQSNTNLANTAGWAAVSPAVNVAGDDNPKTLTIAGGAPGLRRGCFCASTPLAAGFGAHALGRKGKATRAK